MEINGSNTPFAAGIFRCGPCPVVAVQQHCFSTPYDTPFIYASVDADVVRLILRNGQVVGRKVDSEQVGQLIYTKSIGSDKPQNLARTYKGKKSKTGSAVFGAFYKEKSTELEMKNKSDTEMFSQHTVCDFLTISFPFPGPQPSDSPPVSGMLGQWLCNKSFSPSQEFASFFQHVFYKVIFFLFPPFFNGTTRTATKPHDEW